MVFGSSILTDFFSLPCVLARQPPLPAITPPITPPSRPHSPQLHCRLRRGGFGGAIISIAAHAVLIALPGALPARAQADAYGMVNWGCCARPTTLTSTALR